MRLRLFFLALLLSASSIVAQQTGTTNQRLHSLETGFNQAQKDSINKVIQAQDSLQVIDGVAKVLINPDDNHGLQISRPNDDVGIKIKINDQKTGWIVFENQDGSDVGEIEFDTDGTTKTFEIGTNTDYPVLIRSNGNNTVSIDDAKLAVDGYITGDSVLVDGRKLLKDNFYNALDEESTPDAVDKLLIIDGTTLKYTNVEDLILANVDTILTGTATISVGADSVIVTHGLGSAPLISNINVSPQENYQGMSYWVQDITSTTFKIKMDTTVAFDDATEAISFSWQIFNADVVSITNNDYRTFEDFLAVGDGITNDSAAVVNALKSGYPIKGISGKTYLVNNASVITLAGYNIDLSSTGLEPFTIQFGNKENGFLFQGTSILSSTTILNDSVSVGTRKLVLTTTTDIDTGDLVNLRSMGNEYWGVINDNIRKFDLSLVTAIHGDTLYLAQTTWDSYDGASNSDPASLRIYRPITVRMKNVNFLYTGTTSADDMLALSLLYTKYDRLENIRIDNARYCGIQFSVSYGSKVINPIVTNADWNASSYGVYIGSSFDVEVIGGKFIDCHTAVDGGTLITRGCRVIDNTVTMNKDILGSQAFNVHQQSENWVFENNTVFSAYSAFGAAGGGHILRNNVIYNSNGYPFLIRGSDITIEGNVFNTLPVTDYAITFSPDVLVTMNIYSTLTEIQNISIKNNVASHTKYGILYLNGNGNLTNLDISGNKILHVSNSANIISASVVDTVYYSDIRDNFLAHPINYRSSGLSANIEFIDSYTEYKNSLTNITTINGNYVFDGTVNINGTDIDSLANIVSNFSVNEDTTITSITVNGTCTGSYTAGLAPNVSSGGLITPTEETGYDGDGQGFTSTTWIGGGNVRWISNDTLLANSLYKLTFYAKKLSGGTLEKMNVYIEDNEYAGGFLPTSTFQQFEYTFSPTVGVTSGDVVLRFGNYTYPDTAAVFVLDNIELRLLDYGISVTNLNVDSVIIMTAIDSLPYATTNVKIGNVGGELKVMDSGRNEFNLTNFPPVTIPSDSTGLSTGSIYFDATGILRRKY